MRLVVQRVKSASVKVMNNVVGKIEKGFLVYLGIHRDDTILDVEKYVAKLVKLRIFEDDSEKMNLSINDVSGQILLISQFTLYANAKKGNRPSFVDAMSSSNAKNIYELFINLLSKKVKIETGVFQENMEVESINDGPVTIIIENL